MGRRPLVPRYTIAHGEQLFALLPDPTRRIELSDTSPNNRGLAARLSNPEDRKPALTGNMGSTQVAAGLLLVLSLPSLVRLLSGSLLGGLG
jgi:hypothetical protein